MTDSANDDSVRPTAGEDRWWENFQPATPEPATPVPPADTTPFSTPPFNTAPPNAALRDTTPSETTPPETALHNPMTGPFPYAPPPVTPTTPWRASGEMGAMYAPPPGYTASPGYAPQSTYPPGYAYPAESYPPVAYPTASAPPGQLCQTAYGTFVVSPKSRLAAGLLGIFLGGLGIGQFYRGNVGLGIAQIAVTLCTAGVGGLWGFIEGIVTLCVQPGTPLTLDADKRLMLMS